MTEISTAKLLEAIEQLDTFKIRWLLDQGVDVNQHGTRVIDTPLNHAVAYQSPEVTKILLEKGAYPKDFIMCTFSDILHKQNYQPSQQSLDILLLLIDANINLDCSLETEMTLLMQAAGSGSINLVKWLVEGGADVNKVGRKGHYALLQAACNGYLQVYEYLLPLTSPNLVAEAAKSLPNGLRFRQRKDDELLAKFFDAVGSSNLSLLEDCITLGVDVNAFNTSGDTALCTAAIIGADLVVCKLIKAGANVNLGNEVSGHTPLMYAAGYIAQAIHYSESERKMEYLEVIKFLIDAGANVNQTDQDGFSALMAAANSKSMQAVEQILQAGANFNARDHQSRSVLFYANQLGNSEVIQLLVNAGASL